MSSPSAATRRNFVAMGVSPWTDERLRVSSPEGTTGTSFHFAPLGLSRSDAFVAHGLAPVATTYRPVGTDSRGEMPRPCAEQHAESAKREQAIKANLRGLGYGR